MLNDIMSLAGELERLNVRTRDLTAHIEDGRAKLYLNWRVASLRRRLPRLFQDGGYVPLRVEGSGADYLCAFARHFV